MVDKISRMFSSVQGKDLYERIMKTMTEYKMHSLLQTGALVGFSGGSDSVMLMCFIHEYREKNKLNFSVCAAHLNHMIRGAEAVRDADFSRSFASLLGIDFVLREVDIPRLARESGTGIEETARNARYSFFEDIIQSRNDLCSIFLAHNSTDNAETVIFNMLRGSGVNGMCGIQPVRDNIARPLINIPKATISKMLKDFDIPFVTDSTNASSLYSRNYIRNEILPLFSRLTPHPEDMIGRMSSNLRTANSYLTLQAERILSEIDDPYCFSIEKFRGLHDAVLAPVFARLVSSTCGVNVSEEHIRALNSMISRDDFRISVGDNFDFLCDRGVCTFVKTDGIQSYDYVYELKNGLNCIPGTNAAILIGDDLDKSSSFIYNFSIKARFTHDIINKGLHLRFRRDGDSYRYGGHTHRLKKVFNDRGIPAFMRQSIPVLCDENGILWVPGLSVRDDARVSGDSEYIEITLLLDTGNKSGVRKLYAATQYDADKT